MVRGMAIIGVLMASLFKVDAQCEIGGLKPTYCLNAAPASLSTSAGGIMSGPGISGNLFTASVAGTGVHTISSEYCSATYSLSQIPYTFTTTAANVVTLTNNEMSGAIPIGFPFRFFCNTYTDFYFSSNGFITFSPGQSDGCCQGLPLPAAGNAPRNMIALAWTDLNPTFGGTIRYETSGTAPNRMLMVNYNCIFHHNNGNGGDAVVTTLFLFESGNIIEIHTTSKPVATYPINTTMGIQNLSGTDAYVVPGRNGTAAWTATNDAYRFTPGPVCSVTATTSVIPSPALQIGWQRKIICRGETNQLTASGAQSYTWSTGDQTFFTAVSPTVSTIYSVTALGANGCAAAGTVQINVDECLATIENRIGETKIFPNPAGELLFIESQQDAHLSIINGYGVLVRTLRVKAGAPAEADMKDLPAGIYYVLVESRDDSYTRRIVLTGK